MKIDSSPFNWRFCGNALHTAADLSLLDPSSSPDTRTNTRNPSFQNGVHRLARIATLETPYLGPQMGVRLHREELETLGQSTDPQEIHQVFRLIIRQRTRGVGSELTNAPQRISIDQVN
jgi:hypothetical protein